MADSYPATRGRASVSPHADRQYHGNGQSKHQPEDDYDSDEQVEDENDDYYSILNVPHDVRPESLGKNRGGSTVN